jgi:hypothetical protein
MKKLTLLSIIAIILWASPVMAELFTNGGFETGDFTGWTIDYGRRLVGHNIDWDLTGEGTIPSPGIWTSSDTTTAGETMTEDINPYIGTYMARIGDSFGNWHATKLTQTGTIGDYDEKLYVNWGAVLINPTNYDHGDDRPFFTIEVSIEGNPVTSFWADSSNPGFHTIGTVPPPENSNYGNMMYNYDTWSFDLTSYNVGDSVTITMIIADCGAGGHGAFAFLDGIGTTYNPIVPVPGAVLLGILGMTISGLKLRKFV